MRTVVIAVVSLVAAPAAIQVGTVPIREWKVPWENSRPRDPAVAPDGRIWFVGQEGNYVARLDPGRGTFDRFEVDPGTHPHNVIVDAAGNAWYAGNRNAMIGRIDGTTGTITRYPMPDAAATDPHTLVLDRQGTIWFTVQNGNYVGKLVTATGKISLARIATPGARPYGIVLAADGRPWFDLFGTNKLATVDPVTMVVTEHTLPNPRTRPRRIAMTSDGAVWYGDYTAGAIGRLDPKTGAVKEWPAPGGVGSLPYAMTVDDQDRIWIVETGPKPNRLVGFDTKSERYLESTPIPSGGGTVRHMVFDRTTRVVWFGTDANTIGRAEIGKAGKSGRVSGS